MTDISYDAQSTLASVQPGPKWAEVYFGLLERGVCVTGGREGNVGIAGFLTGGGNSYYAGLHGLGCDNIANFEVVLTNENIINANTAAHSDL
jgi:FAD/FMN-containing dehydrogenase